MNTESPLGWLLLMTGIALALVGLMLLAGPTLPWLGRLPGDIRIERENFRFYFPLATCLLLSLLLSGAVWLIRILNR